MEKSQEFISSKYDEMLSKLNSNNELINNMSKTIESLVGKVKERDEVISQLTTRLNHLEQYGRNCNLELCEVKETEGENLENIVLNVAKKMDIYLEPNDIDIVHRLPGKKDKIRSIIVQFSSRKKRDEFIVKKNKIKVTNNDAARNGSDSKIYVNENMTPYFKNLLWKTKTAAHANGYTFAWFRFGRILVRKDESAGVIRINNETDLDKLV